jgi:hypothetical protein
VRLGATWAEREEQTALAEKEEPMASATLPLAPRPRP